MPKQPYPSQMAPKPKSKKQSMNTGIMGSTPDQRKKSNMDYVKSAARIAIDPLNVVGALRRAVSPSASKRVRLSPTGKRASSRIADSSRKTKQAQSIAMDKVKSVKSASADSKRKTAQGKSYPPSKKAPSSYALGLTPSQKKKKQG